VQTFPTSARAAISISSSNKYIHAEREKRLFDIGTLCIEVAWRWRTDPSSLERTRPIKQAQVDRTPAPPPYHRRRALIRPAESHGWVMRRARAAAGVVLFYNGCDCKARRCFVIGALLCGG